MVFRCRTAQIVSITINLLLVCSAASAAIPTTERDALIALYNATNGASWIDSTNWLGSPPENSPGATHSLVVVNDQTSDAVVPNGSQNGSPFATIFQ